MILNTGGRTDTVQYYSQWLLNRFKDGFVYSRNPMFPKKITKYILTPDKIDCVIFCSKNYAPILPRLHEITDKFNTYFHYTITAYDKDIEPNVPSIDESINTLLKLEQIVGSKRIAWRYDPILLTKEYTINRHIKTFEYMAKKLSGHIDRCIFSFVEMYKKLQTNMPEIILFSEEQKNKIAKEIGYIAKKYNIHIQTCGTNDTYEEYGIHKSGCMTLDILSKANGIRFKKIKHNGMRKGCHCIQARDIGAYNTCPNGCKYCYATKNHDNVKDIVKQHNPKSPLLIWEIKKDDIISDLNQKSLITNNKYIQQKNLFNL